MRAVLNGLDDAELLTSFHTSIATYPGNIYHRLGSFKPFADFRRRAFQPSLRFRTHTYPWVEMGRLVSNRLGLESLIRHESGVFSVDAVYHHLDRKVARHLSQHPPRAMYAYEDGAEYSFSEAQRLGVPCLYDLPIGYWRAARRLLGRIIDDRPEWGMTIRTMRDSDKKLARKDEELRLANHIFVASSFTASTLKDYPGELAPVSVIPYGFPTPATNRTYESAKNRPLRLLFVGGLSQRKGIAEMFEAVGHFGNRVELTVVGRRPNVDCPALEKALSHHRYIPSLPHQEILELMANQDVLLFPSLFEGFGLVITEAMSQGTPVIATERTAGPDLIEHDRDGFLIPAGSVDALAAQIESLLSQPERIASVGQAAIQRAKERPWYVYSQEVAATIQKLLA